jgi:hypothetical protein
VRLVKGREFQRKVVLPLSSVSYTVIDTLRVPAFVNASAGMAQVYTSSFFTRVSKPFSPEAWLSHLIYLCSQFSKDTPASPVSNLNDKTEELISLVRPISGLKEVVGVIVFVVALIDSWYEVLVPPCSVPS